MDVTGRVIEVMETQQVSDRFRKREIVIEYATNPEYPEFVKFEFVQDRTALLDKVRPGDDVKIFFDLAGRKWTNGEGKVQYFNTLKGWKLELESANGPSETPSQPPQGHGPAGNIPPPPEFNAADEVPF